ncbi:hypothetical protein EA473_06860 [Natrarchaeobius chitinivorans]|uniref:Uncharacterized protein n=1 Tax=Natrarchaeobius chitinivorans TaxID=1679083 RepID=A0A3N6LYJ4_NATCH|nr:hypothetical protein EA473_06860 [Natrarchaeobius chitinivorans]
MAIGRPPAAVFDGDGREFATALSLASVRQYENRRSRELRYKNRSTPSLARGSAHRTGHISSVRSPPP